MAAVKTASEYLTQAIVWLQSVEKSKKDSALASVLLCWLMQTRCRTGSQSAHTDGANVWINESWFSSMSVAHRGFVFAHEAMHGVLRHTQQMKQVFGDRRDGAASRAWRRANLAFDAWINHVLSTLFGSRGPDGIYPDNKLPDGSPLFKDVHDFNPDEHDWLWLYKRLNDQAGDGEGGGGFGDGDDMMPGEAGTEIEAELRAGRAIAQGAARAAARQAGSGGGWLERTLGGATVPVQNWRSELWNLLTSSVPQEWSMRRVNKSYACAGGLVGSISSPGMGTVVVATDTSGSMTDDLLAQPVAEVNAILSQCQPETLYQMWIDAEVANVQEVHAGETLVPKPAGGGGTSFRPAFDWIAEHVTDDVSCLLYFTDGYGDWHHIDPPSYPVIWFIVAGGTDEDPPFGRVIRMRQV